MATHLYVARMNDVVRVNHVARMNFYAAPMKEHHP